MQSKATNTIAISRAENVDVVHVIPCTTRYEGPAKVKNYFNPAIKIEGDHYRVSLLGRQLKGVDCEAKENYAIFLCQNNESKMDRRLIVEKVGKLREWSQDIPKPKEELSINGMTEWSIIQEAIHTYD